MSASRCALVLASCAGLLALSCGSVCPPKTLADINARYSAAALRECHGYPSLAECPAAPGLKAERREAELAASCR